MFLTFVDWLVVCAAAGAGDAGGDSGSVLNGIVIARLAVCTRGSSFAGGALPPPSAGGSSSSPSAATGPPPPW